MPVEGENFNESSRTINWEIRDIFIPGNAGLDIEVYRSYNKIGSIWLLALESWELEVPKIVLTTNSTGYSKGELEGIGLCENPADSGLTYNGWTWAVGHDWGQMQLILPGKSPKPLLFKGTEIAFPQDVKYVTTDNWIARCVVTSNTAGLKSAFEVVSPDGTTYTFDKIGRQPALAWGLLDGAEITVSATKIKDKFGNTLTYTYNEYISNTNYSAWGQSYAPFIRHYLLSIIASDGRAVNFTYENLSTRKRITKATANGQEWIYQYNDRTERGIIQEGSNRDGTMEVDAAILKKVVLPDGSSWQYENAKIITPQPDSYYQGMPRTSDMYAVLNNGDQYHKLSKIITPKGLTVAYQYRECPWRAVSQMDMVRCPAFNGNYYGPASPITQRTVSGTNLDSSTWTFGVSSEPMDVSKYYINSTIITTPTEITVLKYYDFQIRGAHSLQWKHGLPVSREVFMPGGNPATDQPIYKISYNWQKLRKAGDDHIAKEGLDTGAMQFNWYQRQLASKVVTVDGKTYTTTYSNYDEFGHPKSIVETGNDTRTTNFTYYDNTTNWLIGLPDDEVIADGGTIDRTYNSNGTLRVSI